MATREEFAEAVLEELVSEDLHQAPNAADTEAVLRRYERKYINLADENLADWAVGGDIPDGAMTGLTKIIAYECRRMFGANIGREMYEEGVSDLARYMCRRATFEPVRPDYF